MYHKFRKDSEHLRTAIFRTYDEKCSYCGRKIQQRDLCIDHIIPVNQPQTNDQEMLAYLSELHEKGFIVDSIENYLPCCTACNRKKSNDLFSVSNLRFYHEIANKNAERILELISEQKNEDSCYTPLDSSLWKEVDFTNQHDLSYAIMGYRLSSADVEACPRLNQVNAIKKRLEIVDYTVISGEAGCGKSVSAYQAAYDYYKKGWKIYRYLPSDDIDTIKIPTKSERTLYILDDAQQLPEHTIESIKYQARPNSKVIVCITLVSKIEEDIILISRKEAVEVLYDYYLKNKRKVINIVQKCDKSIGTSLTDQSIENRLLNAKKSSTPWQFNYILRGGWQTIKERYREACMHKNLDLLSATIGVCQIIKMDHSTDFGWICKELKRIDSSLSWAEEELMELKNKAIILSEKDLRIVHIESANIIVTLFLEEGEINHQKTLLQFIENNYINGTFSPLGLVWLVNGIGRYNIIPGTCLRPITERMIKHTLDDLSNYSLPEERAQVAYFWEMICHYPSERRTAYFKTHEETLLNWFEHADNQNVYAYSRLLNTLVNNDIAQHKRIALRIDWAQIMNSVIEEKNPKFYAWGQFINRLAYSLKREDCFLLREQISLVVEQLSTRASIENISELTSFFCSVIYINEESVRKAIVQMLPIYETYFQTDMLHAIYLFDFEFVEYVCGLDLFAVRRATEQQKNTARLIVSVIPAMELASVFSECAPRDWHTIQWIMQIIQKYDSKKAKDIIRHVDLKRLSMNSTASWGKCYEITELCDILSMGDVITAREFISMNIKQIQIIYAAFIIISPKDCAQLIKKGCKIELICDNWWGLGLRALKKIQLTDEKVYDLLLQKSIDNIVVNINTITKLDVDDSWCLDFLSFIKNTSPDAFAVIVNRIDKSNILKNWNNGIVHPRKKKVAKMREVKLFSILGMTDIIEQQT